MKSKKTRNKLGRDLSKTRENDSLDERSRSQLMSKIRSKNTKFEIDFINDLKNEIDILFELNVKDIKGKPDIIFRSEKVCVFLDSDFWHGWQFPRWKHLLKNDFWREKIKRNRQRDKNTTQYLRRQGWKVIRIWGHEIRENKSIQIKNIIDAIDKDNNK